MEELIDELSGFGIVPTVYLGKAGTPNLGRISRQ
jgi:hypothetical protein